MADETPHRTCGTMAVHQQLMATDPSYVTNRAAIENHALEFARTQGMNARTGVTVIPVVVHVVFNTPAENISDAQIHSQIDVLNHDFRMTNTDLPKVPAPFKSLAADARIEFVLASKDPMNNPTTGIIRTSTTSTSFSDDNKVKHAASGGADAWPADKYLNIWVCPLGGGLLGYAQFPGGPAATDGVVILHSGFGTVGTAAAPFNLGRSATHEIGHFFNLLHIWGDDGGACTGTDMVGDTPNQADHNFGKPTFPHVTCGNGPNGDMFMNYMDYTDDDSMFMFTAGQVTRMQATLDGPRSTLGTQKVVTSKFIDDQVVTLKFNDDHVGTSKFLDDHVTLKFNDDHTTLKFSDDHVGTLKFIEDPIGKSPVVDLPKGAGADNPGFPGNNPPGGGGFAGGRSGSAVPFVLATPHHSRAWTQSFPQAFLASVQLYEQRLGQIEQILQQYQQGEQGGLLSDSDRQEANQVYDEYQRLMAEYTNLTQG